MSLCSPVLLAVIEWCLALSLLNSSSSNWTEMCQRGTVGACSTVVLPQLSMVPFHMDVLNVLGKLW